ncbi:LANO_0G12354g1_1 [Lachancea nothofagi CBS 11611]|uniref:LANO_0G12354g1_1 n=1 Tax=Lachancea nothofagi CBS 11611 TaxID=1266666 RepID=A0A1G4KJP5_9SACH|nr:LANO_0G12354g1_1 [Lachancea nothofagi CBS 11611]
MPGEKSPEDVIQRSSSEFDTPSLEEHRKTQTVVSYNREDIGNADNVLSTILSPSGREVKVTGDVDDAMKLALESQRIVISPEEDARLVRKIDLYMFPLLCLLYAIQFMDKISNGSAAVMGLREDLKMHGDQYSWVGSAFYFGYLFFNMGPGQYIFQKSRWLAKTLAVFVIIWGTFLALHAAPSVTYPTFILLRVLLGCAESMVTPTFTIITSQYWKKEEQFMRVCLWFGFNGLGGIWANALAYGLYTRQQTYSMEAWRILFIVTGIITIVVGFAIFFHIPDDPSKAWFLSEREKFMVVERIRSNQQGFGNHHIKWYQVKEAFTDVRTWLYFIFSVGSNIPNGGLTNFMNILIKNDFGYSTSQSLLMTMPTGAVELVVCPLFGYLSVISAKRKVPFLQYRLSWAIISALISVLATCLLAFANSSPKTKLAGAYLLYVSPISFICVLSIISSNTLGFSKKWTVSSINLVSYAAANLAGPQTFIATQAPSYTGAKIAMLVCYAGTVVVLAILFVINYRENLKRDQIQAERGPDDIIIENLEFADLTDKENPNFRYAL